MYSDEFEKDLFAMGYTILPTLGYPFDANQPGTQTDVAGFLDEAGRNLNCRVFVRRAQPVSNTVITTPEAFLLTQDNYLPKEIWKLSVSGGFRYYVFGNTKTVVINVNTTGAEVPQFTMINEILDALTGQAYIHGLQTSAQTCATNLGGVRGQLQLAQLNATALQKKIDTLTAQLAQAQNDNGNAAQINDLTAKLTAAQTSLTAAQNQVATLQDAITALQQNEGTGVNSVFSKPCPAIMWEAKPEQVMLGNFVVTTAQGQSTHNYLAHSSFLCPSAFYEEVLNLAQCNKPLAQLNMTELQVIAKIANTIQPMMRYIDDQTQWGRMDNWTTAQTVLAMKQDDCENLSQNILSAILYYETKFGAFKDYSVFLGLGFLVEGGQDYGHGFVVITHNTSTSLDDSYILEATNNFASPPMEMSAIKANYTIEWGLIGYVRNGHEDGSYNFAAPWWNTAGKEVGANAHRWKEADPKRRQDKRDAILRVHNAYINKKRTR